MSYTQTREKKIIRTLSLPRWRYGHREFFSSHFQGRALSRRAHPQRVSPHVLSAHSLTTPSFTELEAIPSSLPANGSCEITFRILLSAPYLWSLSHRLRRSSSRLNAQTSSFGILMRYLDEFCLFQTKRPRERAVGGIWDNVSRFAGWKLEISKWARGRTSQRARKHSFGTFYRSRWRESWRSAGQVRGSITGGRESSVPIFWSVIYRAVCHLTRRCSYVKFQSCNEKLSAVQYRNLAQARLTGTSADASAAAQC